MNYNEIFASCIMSELRNEADISLADDGGIELRNYNIYPF